tara:strand:+ start:3856 stop:4065 length:210 start_codon:yes stop_codon:yes gene_type:complete
MYAKMTRPPFSPPSGAYALVEKLNSVPSLRMTWPLDGALSDFMGNALVRYVWLIEDKHAKNGYHYEELS